MVRDCIDRVPKWCGYKRTCHERWRQHSDDVIYGKKWCCERLIVQRRDCELAVERYHGPHLTV